MIYFNIEIKEHDFTGLEYVRHTNRGKSEIIKNIWGFTGVTSCYGSFYVDYRNPTILKYIMCGFFHSYEPYSK